MLGTRSWQATTISTSSSTPTLQLPSGHQLKSAVSLFVVIYTELSSLLGDFYLLASKGISANLLKLGTKRRRTKAEIAQLKEEEECKAEAEDNKTARILELEQQLKDV